MVEGVPSIQAVDQGVSSEPGGVEDETSVWEEESGGDRVRYDEGEIWRRTEFEKIQRTKKRVTHQGDFAQYWEVELLGMCREVIYWTDFIVESRLKSDIYPFVVVS